MSDYYIRLGSIACYQLDYGSHEFANGLIRTGTIVAVCDKIQPDVNRCWVDYYLCYEFINGEYVLQMIPISYPTYPSCPEGCEQFCD